MESAKETKTYPYSKKYNPPTNSFIEPEPKPKPKPKPVKTKRPRNKEKAAAYSRKYYKKNKEYCLARSRKYASENPKRAAYTQKKYDLKMKLQRAKERVIKIKQEIHEHLSNKPKP